jgi:hypothetical protein
MEPIAQKNSPAAASPGLAAVEEPRQKEPECHHRPEKQRQSKVKQQQHPSVKHPTDQQKKAETSQKIEQEAGL